MPERKGIYASTAWMLAAVVIFYGLLMLTNRVMDRTGELEKSKQETTVSAQQLKAREEAFKEKLLGDPDLAMKISLVFMLIVGTGLYIDGWLVWKKIRRSPWIGGGVLQVPAAWGLREVLHVVVFLFFVEVVLLSLELVLRSFGAFKGVSPDVLVMFNSLIRDILAAAMVITIVRTKFRQPLADIGLTRHAFWGNVRRGLLAYLAILPVFLIALTLLAGLLDLFKYEPQPQNVVQMYLRPATGAYILAFTLFVALAGPIIEEIFFRGFMYKAFRARLGVVGGMAVTAAIFSAFHVSLVTFIPIFILGYFLTYLYEETGSLVPSMTAHIAHNLLMVLLTLGFKSLSG